MRLAIAAFGLSILCTATASLAQSESNLSIELNRSGATSDDVCQVVFVGRNGLGEDLEDIRCVVSSIRKLRCLT